MIGSVLRLDATDSWGYNTHMSIHIHGTYKAGVIYPEQPLALPDDTKVELVVTTISNVSESKVDNHRPQAPQISVEELRERIRRYSVAAGSSLPADFSRDDIYDDHD